MTVSAPRPALVELARFGANGTQMSLVPTILAPTALRRLNFEDRAEWRFFGPPDAALDAAAVLASGLSLWDAAAVEQKAAVAEREEPQPSSASPFAAGLRISWLGATPFEVWEQIAESVGSQMIAQWLAGGEGRGVSLRVGREPDLALWLGDPALRDEAAALWAEALPSGPDPDDALLGAGDEPPPRLRALQFFGAQALPPSEGLEFEPVEFLPDPAPAACVLIGAQALERLMNRWVQEGRALAQQDAAQDPDLAALRGAFDQRAWPPAALARAPLWAARSLAPKAAVSLKFVGALSTRPFPWLATARCAAPAAEAQAWAARVQAFCGAGSALLPLSALPLSTFSDAKAQLEASVSAGCPSLPAASGSTIETQRPLPNAC